MAKMGDVEVRQVEESDISWVFLLHNRYTGGERTPEQWLWEYRGLNSDASVFLVLKDGNQIVGTQGMIPIYLSTPSGKVLSGKSENTLLEKRYRGRGLLEELYSKAMEECSKKGIACVWGYTSATKVWRDKLGFRVYEKEMKSAILLVDFEVAREQKSRILKSRSGIKSIVFDCALKAVTVYSAFRRKLSAFSCPKGTFSFQLEEKPRSWTDLKMFFNYWRKQYPNLICIEQNEQYLTWRLYDNPHNSPITAFVYSQGQLEGYAYLTIRGSIAEITDLLFRRVEVGWFLMNEIFRHVTERRVGIVLYSGNITNPVNRNVFGFLRKFGFITVRRLGGAFVLKNINYPDENTIYDVKNWYLTELWNEGT